MLRLQGAHGLRVLEPFGKGKHQDRIETVDAVAVIFQKLGRAGRVGGQRVSQGPSLSV